MSSLLLAARYLTIVPLTRRAHAPAAGLGRAAPWFPVVGLGLGVTLVLTEWVTAWIFPPLLSALLTVTTWKLLTGGLHLDGLADCLDGLAGRDPAHRLAIMSDSRIGALGAMGLILFLLIELAAIAELPSTARWQALLAAPVIGRATPALLARLFRPARADGLGASFRAGLSAWAPPIAVGVAFLVAVPVLGWAGPVALAAGLIAAVGVGRFMAGRLGGITGDVLGAAVESAELAVLLMVSAWTRLEL